MTVIKLDAATLAKVKAGDGRVILADENGTPMRICQVQPLDQEPKYSEEEWRALLGGSEKLTTDQVIERLTKGKAE